MSKIEIETIGNVQVISSWYFYKFLKLAPARYNKWVKIHVLDRGIKNFDYYNLENPGFWDKKKKTRVRLHITIDYAIGITICYDTLMAKSIRRELMKIRERHIPKST